ncbi:MAG: hypothetical protein ACOX62_06215 [Christensenellales bacterium]|jgi:hypothetical protein
MYTQDDIDSLGKQLRKRVLVWLIPETMLLAVIVFSFTRRMEWLTGLSLALLSMLLMFSLSMSIFPVKRYQRFLYNAVKGRNRVDLVHFASMDTELVYREGVRFYPVTMRADTLKEEYEERQYYWDANLALPDWQQDEFLRLTSHEKMITAWERVLKEAL